jgi:hypothetical protein
MMPNPDDGGYLQDQFNHRNPENQGNYLFSYGPMVKFHIIMRHLRTIGIPFILAAAMGTAGESVSVFHEIDGTVCFEAEHAQYRYRYSETRGASGTAMAADSAGAWRGGVLRFRIRFKTAGRYAFWLLARRDPDQVPVAGNDVWVLVDRDFSSRTLPEFRSIQARSAGALLDADGNTLAGNRAPESRIRFGEKEGFRWFCAPTRGNGPMFWQVDSAGDHWLELATGAEWGFAVDKGVLTRDNLHPPEGLGPDETDSPGASPYAAGPARVPMLPPAWAFGVWWGLDRNLDQNAAHEVSERLIREGYPIDALWLGSVFRRRGMDPDNVFRVDTKAFPDPKQLWTALGNRHIKAGVRIEPGIPVGSDAPRLGNAAPSGRDATALVRKKSKRLFRDGIDFLKLEGPAPLAGLRAAFECSQEFGRETGGRGIVLSRPTETDGREFRRSPLEIAGDSKPLPEAARGFEARSLDEAIQSLGDPGAPSYDIPFFSHAAPGFSGADEGTRGEALAIRWIQMCAFSPVMEVLCSSRMPWDLQPDAQSAVRRVMQLRMRLFPYIYTWALRSHLDGARLVRGERDRPGQYRFGDSFLVAPVSAPDSGSVLVFLPEGRWVDYWSDSVVTGGRSVTVETPLDRFPLFLKQGAIVPMRSYARCADLLDRGALTLDVTPTAEGAFTLLEDDGASNEYLTGMIGSTAFAVLPDSNSVTFTAGGVRGSYRGMPMVRTFTLRLRLTDAPSTVTLNGKALGRLDAEPGETEGGQGWWADPDRRVVKVRWSTAARSESAIRVNR